MDTPVGDKPFVPCYESNLCGKVYNCGDDNCKTPTPSIGVKKCEGTTESICWGNDADYCSGISRFCPSEDLPCDSQGNPAKDVLFKNFFGCDVSKDPNCLEFETRTDQYTGCRKDCWKYGGREEVNNTCVTLNQGQCNAFNYFCEWKDNKCQAIANDPLDTYIDKNSKLPDGISVEDIPGVGELRCAKSSYDSKKLTSYSEDSRICCLTTPEKKICISNPRCQFVESPCQCVFKNIGGTNDPEPIRPLTPVQLAIKRENDHKFLCYSIFNTHKSGYCTWCRGQKADYFPTSSENGLVREQTEWNVVGGKCNNRCPAFNECEVPDSEKKWNECIWFESRGKLGLSPNRVNNNPDLYSTNGYCPASCNRSDYTGPNAEHEFKECEAQKEFADQVQKTCEDKLQPLVMTKSKGQIFNPGYGIESKGQIRGRWNHICTTENTKRVTRNYACTFCPSLQAEDEEELKGQESQVEINEMYIGLGVLITFIVSLIIIIPLAVAIAQL